MVKAMEKIAAELGKVDNAIKNMEEKQRQRSQQKQQQQESSVAEDEGHVVIVD